MKKITYEVKWSKLSNIARNGLELDDMIRELIEDMGAKPEDIVITIESVS